MAGGCGDIEYAGGDDSYDAWMNARTHMGISYSNSLESELGRFCSNIPHHVQHIQARGFANWVRDVNDSRASMVASK